MQRKLLVFVLAALLGALLAVGATASPPAPASGTLTYLASTFNSVRLEGGNARALVDDGPVTRVPAVARPELGSGRRCG